MAKHIATGTPTQVAHPANAALRTAVAYALAAAGFLALAIPVLIDTMGPYLPESWAAWLTGAVAFLVALATLITRLMALAKAQDFLAKIGLGTGVEKEPDPDLLEDSVAAQFYAAGYPIPDAHEPTTAHEERYEQ